MPQQLPVQRLSQLLKRNGGRKENYPSRFLKINKSNKEERVRRTSSHTFVPGHKPAARLVSVSKGGFRHRLTACPEQNYDSKRPHYEQSLLVICFLFISEKRC